MVRNWQYAACVAGVLSFAGGCATSGDQSADLSQPPAPRLAWARPQEKTAETATPLPPASDLLIQEHRFVSHSAELNLEGEVQLQQLASTLGESPVQLVIESSRPSAALRVVSQRSPEESGKLDQMRRQYVVQKLLSLGVPDAELRVVLEDN